jgi:hypothetical protein
VCRPKPLLLRRIIPRESTKKPLALASDIVMIKA